MCNSIPYFRQSRVGAGASGSRRHPRPRGWHGGHPSTLRGYRRETTSVLDGIYRLLDDGAPFASIRPANRHPAPATRPTGRPAAGASLGLIPNVNCPAESSNEAHKRSGPLRPAPAARRCGNPARPAALGHRAPPRRLKGHGNVGGSGARRGREPCRRARRSLWAPPQSPCTHRGGRLPPPAAAA